MKKRLSINCLISDWEKNAMDGNSGVFYNAVCTMRINGYISETVWKAFSAYIDKKSRDNTLVAYGDWQGA